MRKERSTSKSCVNIEFPANATKVWLDAGGRNKSVGRTTKGTIFKCLAYLGTLILKMVSHHEKKTVHFPEMIFIKKSNPRDHHQYNYVVRGVYYSVFDGSFNKSLEILSVKNVLRHFFGGRSKFFIEEANASDAQCLSVRNSFGTWRG